jgi:hypothetical protein
MVNSYCPQKTLCYAQAALYSHLDRISSYFPLFLTPAFLFLNPCAFIFTYITVYRRESVWKKGSNRAEPAYGHFKTGDENRR